MKVGVIVGNVNINFNFHTTSYLPYNENI